MKICSQCKRTFSDDTLNYCLDDGTVLTPLADDSNSETLLMSQPRSTAPTEPMINTRPDASVVTVVRPVTIPPTEATINTGPDRSVVTVVKPGTIPQKTGSLAWLWVAIGFGGLVLIFGGGLIALFLMMSNRQQALANVNTSDPRSTSSERTPAQSATPQRSALLDKYYKLDLGISYKQAAAVLGKEGSEISKSNISGQKMAMYNFDGDAPNSSVMLMFNNDKLWSKTQIGLSTRKNLILTRAKYDALRDGMTYNETVSVMGAEGEEKSSTAIMSINSVGYEWLGTGSSQVEATFINGQLNSKHQTGVD